MAVLPRRAVCTRSISARCRRRSAGTFTDVGTWRAPSRPWRCAARPLTAARPRSAWCWLRAGLDLEIADQRLRRTRPTARTLRPRRGEGGVEQGGAERAPRAVVDAAERHVLADEAACAAGEHGACEGPRRASPLPLRRARHLRAGHRPWRHQTRVRRARTCAWSRSRRGRLAGRATDGVERLREGIGHAHHRRHVGLAIERLGVTRAVVGADRIAQDGSTANKIGTHVGDGMRGGWRALPCRTAVDL